VSSFDDVIQLHHHAFEAAVGLPDVEREAQGLDDFVFAGEDFVWFGGDALGEGRDGPAVGFGFVGEVEGCFVDFLGRVR